MQLDSNRIGKAEVDELKRAIGDVFSDNASSTYRSKLVGISDDGLIAYTEEVKSEHSSKKPVGGRHEQPSWLAWNGMFY
tara:strand:+ start:94 stop:330 length:237 start_codon:yes stop_codon:yes gene_type:complete